MCAGWGFRVRFRRHAERGYAVIDADTCSVGARDSRWRSRRPDQTARCVAFAMKILIVDDHQLFREGVALLLRRLADDLDLLQASNCDEAFSLCEANASIDLILLDLNMAGMDGLDGLSVFRERFAEIPVVVLSTSDDQPTVRRAIDRGAMGFIPKNSSSEIMLSALRLVLAKGIYLPRNILTADPSHAPLGDPQRSFPAVLRLPTAGPLTPLDLGLTPRQADVLHLVLQGKPIKLICRELGLAEGTVKSHVSAVLRALNVTTRTQAIVAASRLGLLFDPASSASRVK